MAPLRASKYTHSNHVGSVLTARHIEGMFAGLLNNLLAFKGPFNSVGMIHLFYGPLVQVIAPKGAQMLVVYMCARIHWKLAFSIKRGDSDVQKMGIKAAKELI